MVLHIVDCVENKKGGVAIGIFTENKEIWVCPCQSNSTECIICSLQLKERLYTCFFAWVHEGAKRGTLLCGIVPIKL